MLQYLKKHTDRAFRICAFGSSNTELSLANQGRHNWVDWLSIQLRESIGHHVQTINLGIGGETTKELVNRLERDVRPFQPSYVIITIGGNDANQQIPTEVYTERLHTICTAIQSEQAVPVLQTYYCPLYHLSDPGFEARFIALMQANRDLSSALGIPLVDQYAYFKPLYRQDPVTYEKLMRDWLHVNHLGNLAMGRIISKAFGLGLLPVPDDLAADFNPIFEKMMTLASAAH